MSVSHKLKDGVGACMAKGVPGIKTSMQMSSLRGVGHAVAVLHTHVALAQEDWSLLHTLCRVRMQWSCCLHAGLNTFGTSRSLIDQNQGSMGFNSGILLAGQAGVKGLAQPFQGQAMAHGITPTPHAFVPMTQQSANTMQTGISQPPMQPLLRNGTIYPAHIHQGYQYTSPITLNQQSLQPRQGSAPFSTQSGQAGAHSMLNSGSMGSTEQCRTSSAQPM